MARIDERLILIRHKRIVRAIASAGQNNRFRMDGIGLAVALGLHAGDHAILHNQFRRGSINHQRAALSHIFV